MNINLTLFGQTISFFLFVWFCMKFVWPPIMQALEERKAKIADGLAAADRGKHEQELAEKRAKDLLVEAKREAAEIIANANKRANEIVEESKGDARTEGERIVVAARAEIDKERNQAREELRAQVVSLALAGAEKVLGREINATEHNDYLTKMSAQL
ncbi:MAG: F0F1 ATP synthase subunit B [Gammaproteobacteria bacterium]|nr:F0F1 ATP synthase subunit B [Gammaproteobacteria bacterium]MCP5138214.1 F0F1 ATP synthase subunit B [Gammaproteobacteria bacterium]